MQFAFLQIGCESVHILILLGNLQGPVESISVGEIRLSLRQSLVKLGVGFLSRDPKLQWLICDLEVVLRSNKGTQMTGSRKSHSSTKSGRGKWMVVVTIARFLSLSVTELVLKVSNVLYYTNTRVHSLIQIQCGLLMIFVLIFMVVTVVSRVDGGPASQLINDYKYYILYHKYIRLF